VTFYCRDSFSEKSQLVVETMNLTTKTLEEYESRFRNTCELGDVYEKKKRLVTLARELEDWRIMIDKEDHHQHHLDGILDRVKYVSERCGEDIDERDDTNLQGEVVGDIDELLGGLSLEGKGSSLHQQQKQVHVRPGRRYKKVVRKNNPGNAKGVAIVRDQLGDAGSDADDHVPEEKALYVAESSEDEEKRRYVKKDSVLKVDIPVSTDVLVQAAAFARAGEISPATSGGSTKACGVPLTNTTDEYDSDGSITSPAVLGVVSSFSNAERN
jgi:hypothetical protein